MNRGAAEEQVPRPLPRPGMTLVNRMVATALSGRPHRRVERRDLSPWIEESLGSLSRAGGSIEGLEYVRRHTRTWNVSEARAPQEVWCGEVLWTTNGTPQAVIYPDSPWGRLPSERIFSIATQTGMDHIVSHLYRWSVGADYSEVAACSDQVRLMWHRRGLVNRLSAVAILFGLSAHKKIPVRVLLGRCREALPAR